MIYNHVLEALFYISILLGMEKQDSYSKLINSQNTSVTRFIRKPDNFSFIVLIVLLTLGIGYLLPKAAAAAKLLQSCPTLCDPIDGSSPGSAIPGILQARTLEWVAISFSNAWKRKVKWSRSVVSDSSWPHGLQRTRLLHPWDFPGKSTGVVCHCLLRYLKHSND